MKIQQLKEGACWCVHDLLAPDECHQIVSTSLSVGISEKTAAGDKRHRNCCKHSIYDEELADKIWERLRETEAVPREYVIDCNETCPPGFEQESIRIVDLVGRWKPYRVKPTFSVIYYKEGGHFGPHRDAYHSPSKHERSMLTVGIYLANRPGVGIGGATHFLSNDMEMPDVDLDGRIRAPPACIEFKVQADIAGKALVFQHDLMHEGEALSPDAPPKWFLLTQVLYRRDPHSAPQLTGQQMEAREVLAQAEAAEISGNIQTAIRLYSRAYRLDPSLDGT